jgi:hypothetical protein
MDGLPGRLPAGEAVLWQGAPDWRSLVRYGFRMPWIAAYFGLLILVRFGAGMVAGHGLAFALSSAFSGFVMSAAASAMLCALAWLMARTTTYTITARRVVITYGMALPKSLNLPFTAIEGAALGMNEDGTGNILIQVPAKPRLAFLLLWPHVNVVNGRNCPVLRCVKEAPAVAVLLKATAKPEPAVAAPALAIAA